MIVFDFEWSYFFVKTEKRSAEKSVAEPVNHLNRSTNFLLELEAIHIPLQRDTVLATLQQLVQPYVPKLCWQCAERIDNRLCLCLCACRCLCGVGSSDSRLSAPNFTINTAYVQDQLGYLREIILQKSAIMHFKPSISWDNTHPHIAAVKQTRPPPIRRSTPLPVV